MAQAGARRLSGGEIAVVVVSLLLVAAFVVMLAVRLSTADDAGAAGADSGSTPTGTSAASGTSEASTAPPAGEDLSGVAFDFVSPSGNIACDIDGERALCGIAAFDYAEEIPEAETRACEGTVGHYLQVTADGASLVCDTSGQVPAVADGTAVLDYGQTESADGFTCESSETGMACTHDESGYSFSVRRAGYTLS